MDQWQVLLSQSLPVHNDLFAVAAPKIAKLQQFYFSSLDLEVWLIKQISFELIRYRYRYL